MESLDFIMDIAENLKKQKIDFFIVAVRQKEGGDKVDIFQNIERPTSALAVIEVFNKIKAEIFPNGDSNPPKVIKIKKAKKPKKDKGNGDN